LFFSEDFLNAANLYWAEAPDDTDSSGASGDTDSSGDTSHGIASMCKDTSSLHHKEKRQKTV
jgi:hypothetical protein